MNTFDEAIVRLLGALLIILLIPLAFIFSGYTISVLWLWFVVPSFGLAALSIPQAMGISLIVSYLTHQLPKKDEKEDSKNELWRAIGFSLVRPFLALAIGWLILQWM